MNITFLVGNGFDLNLGLTTEYRHFYPFFFQSIANNNKMSYVREFAHMIHDNYENWSDFEWAFARNFDGTSREASQILYTFDQLFAEYLHEQCVDRNYDTAEIKAKFQKFVLSPYECLERAEYSLISEFYRKHKNEKHQYNFINFNYTDTLENLLSQILIPKRTVGNATFLDHCSAPLHIHGSLKENYIIIGIDSTSQILCESTREDEGIGRQCVKSTINLAYGYQEKEDQFENIIKSSNIIYAYGIGFGKTDQRRWNTIRTWLEANADHKLMIFIYKSGFPALSGVNKGLLLDAIDDAKDKYLGLLGFDEKSFQGMRRQIFVADSGDVLQFKLMSSKKELITV